MNRTQAIHNRTGRPCTIMGSNGPQYFCNFGDRPNPFTWVNANELTILAVPAPQHTPGPWTVSDDATEINSHTRRIVDYSMGVCHATDARLISAAPDLLNAAILALQLVRDNWISEHGSEQVGVAWGALQSAIEKATGRGA